MSGELLALDVNRRRRHIINKTVCFYIKIVFEIQILTSLWKLSHVIKCV